MFIEPNIGNGRVAHEVCVPLRAPLNEQPLTAAVRCAVACAAAVLSNMSSLNHMSSFEFFTRGLRLNRPSFGVLHNAAEIIYGTY